MEKQHADRTIEEYFHKIYGFAVKKSYSTEEAEELCAEMVEEVYRSFLKSREIINVEGYVWRICANTYAKYVSAKKKKQGISLDNLILPYYDEYDFGETEEELQKLRREIAFLTERRRRAVWLFYYEGKNVAQISARLGIPEGTVKWHLNRARNDLKEGMSMERKIGKLGLAPIESLSISHSGNPGEGNEPERYIGDRLSLNIVYSVYWNPRTLQEIAEELGMTPVFLEDRVRMLEENGFLVKTTGERYTTYVRFTPRTVSLERWDNVLRAQLQVARVLAEQYVPKVLEAVADVKDVYIPGGNRQLFEAAVIAWAVGEKCKISTAERDLSAYRIRPLGGGDYMATVQLKSEPADPEYRSSLPEADRDYGCCGSMRRDCGKYPCVASWSLDSRYCSRKGAWKNNQARDYEYVYELISGMLTDTAADADKFARMREREFLTDGGEVNIMIVKGDMKAFDDMLPKPDKGIVDQFAGYALEQAMQFAKDYPPQMQDLVVADYAGGFIDPSVAVMVLDILYGSGTFRPLTEREKVTSQLLMFCDRLPG